MKVGDIVKRYDNFNSPVFELEVLKIGSYQTQVKVLYSRVPSLIGRIENWQTRTLKEMQGSEFYYAD